MRVWFFEARFKARVSSYAKTTFTRGKCYANLKPLKLLT